MSFQTYILYIFLTLNIQHDFNEILFFSSLQRNGTDKDCIFFETIGKKTKRTIFTSLEHRTWHIGIKNNGKPRLGFRPNKTTSVHNHTYEFTPMGVWKKKPTSGRKRKGKKGKGGLKGK